MKTLPPPSMQHSVTELPFNRFLGLESSPDPAQLLRLPSGPQYLNGQIPDWDSHGHSKMYFSKHLQQTTAR